MLLIIRQELKAMRLASDQAIETAEREIERMRAEVAALLPLSDELAQARAERDALVAILAERDQNRDLQRAQLETEVATLREQVAQSLLVAAEEERARREADDTWEESIVDELAAEPEPEPVKTLLMVAEEERLAREAAEPAPEVLGSPDELDQADLRTDEQPTEPPPEDVVDVEGSEVPPPPEPEPEPVKTLLMVAEEERLAREADELDQAETAQPTEPPMDVVDVEGSVVPPTEPAPEPTPEG